jgi:glycosyltransferase domain-containing protein
MVEAGRRMNDYTLVVPTLNRSDLLTRLVGYFDALRVAFPIVVLDSSEPGQRAANAAAVAAASIEIAHVPLDGSISFYEKIARGTEAVTTPYVSFCADDDVVLPAAIEEALAFLRSHRDYHVAQGYFFGFRETDRAMAVESVLYATPSIEHGSARDRLYAMVRYYQPVFYGVTRTDVWRRAQARLDAVEGFLFKELLQACETAIFGKIARIPRLHGGRRLENPYADLDNPSNVTGHAVRWCLAEPGRFFTSYAAYRAVVVEALGAAREPSGPCGTLERELDLLHLRFLVTDPGLFRQHAAAMARVTGEARDGQLDAVRHTPCDPAGVVVSCDAAPRGRRTYRLAPAFVKAMSGSRNERPMLDRGDVLAALRALAFYR